SCEGRSVTGGSSRRKGRNASGSAARGRAALERWSSTSKPGSGWPSTRRTELSSAHVNEALAVLQRAARVGGEILVAAFAALDSLHVRAKGPADYVSEADLDAEAAIRSMLMAAIPDAAWRGEESGYALGSSGREWVVDPLDGTTNFLSGIPHFAVSIALREDGETICGVVYQPLIDEMFAAARGAGATRNGAPIRV